MKFFIVFVLFICSFYSVTFSHDVLVLTNEKVFAGKVVRIRNCRVVFKIDRQRFVIPAEDIQMIQFENPSDPVYTSYTGQVRQDENKCLNGRSDAENYHGKKVGHFFLGALFGPFAILGTALAKPTPYKGKDTLLYSKNQEDFADPIYLTCYRKKAKGQLILMEAIGWGVWLLVSSATR